MIDCMATTLIIEAGAKVQTIRLERGLTLAEIWAMFAKPGRRKPVCSLSKGTARVTF